LGVRRLDSESPNSASTARSARAAARGGRRQRGGATDWSGRPPFAPATYI
jgi:hypothetical protein